MTGKMRFCRQPYIGSSIKKPNKVIRKLKRGKKQLKVYLVVVAAETGQIEIYHNILLRQWYFKERPPLVIGVAASHEEAVELVCQITKEALARTGNADLKGYLSVREGKLKQAERF